MESWDNLGDIITDKAESGGLGILLHNSSKSELGGIGHGVTLIKNHQLDTFAHELLSGAEGFDLFSDDVNTSFVGSVEFESQVTVVWTV